MEFYSHISFLLWHIWKHRCHCIFRHDIPQPRKISQSAFMAASEFLASNSPKLHLSPSHKETPPVHQASEPPTRDHWIPPPPDCFKINSDASWHASTLSCGIATLVRNHNGLVIDGSTKVITALSPLAAEALALCEGLKLAASLPQVPIIVESDNLSLIDALKSGAPPSDWNASNIISQARYLSLTRQISWHWASRKANLAADHLAALAYSRKCPPDWVVNPPSSLSNILLYDGLPCPH